MSLLDQIAQVRELCHVPDNVKVWHQDQAMDGTADVCRVFFIEIGGVELDGFPITQSIARCRVSHEQLNQETKEWI